MEKIEQLTLPKEGRVIVISDIHGELDLLKALLKKVDYTAEDYLIINGDLCEKGSDSKGVVSYVMDLAIKNDKVLVTEGNCDTLVEDLMQENPDLIPYLYQRPHSVLNEWLNECGCPIEEGISVQAVKEVLTRYYLQEIEWLKALPTAIETEDYIFVHAGLEDIENWKETKRDTAITLPAFLEKTHRAGKYVIVGHWPVANYHSKVRAHHPIINEEKKMIAIDGGNVIKPTGQLNAFIIQRSPVGDEFTYTHVDRFPTCLVQENYTADPGRSGSISYPHYVVAPIEKHDHFTLCKQVETDELCYVKNEYITQGKDGRFTAKADVSCAELTVQKGDLVSILDDTCAGYTLIKKDGREGWVPKAVMK